MCADFEVTNNLPSQGGVCPKGITGEYLDRLVRRCCSGSARYCLRGSVAHSAFSRLFAVLSILLLALSVSPVLAQEMSTAGKIKLADVSSILAVKRAAESRAKCDPALLRRAVESINQAATLMSEVVVEADNTGDLGLAQQVYDMATNTVGQGIGFIKEVCMHCTQGGLDPVAVKRFQKSCSSAAKIEKLNNDSIDAALAAGALPPQYESKAH